MEILSTNFLSCVNDYIEDIATFTSLAKICSTEYFCNTKVAGLGKIFVQQKFSAIQYSQLTCMIISLHYNHSSKCREMITRVLKPASTATVFNFLLFLSGIKSKESSELSLKEVHFGFNIVCTEGADGTYRLAIEVQSELEAVQSLDTERMERVGSCVLNLLQQDFKSSPVLGMLFVQCLKHLASLLCNKTGYTHPREEEVS